MNTLVAYDNSDDDDDNDNDHENDTGTNNLDATPSLVPTPEPNQEEPKGLQTDPNTSTSTAAKSLVGPPSLATPTPTAPPQPSAPSSPYTNERERIHSLTMPTTANFDIPSSPRALPPNSEAAADLAATTKTFERFLALKAQGVHFNARLQNSTSLRNPSLLPKLMGFAGIASSSGEAGDGGEYASALPERLALPTKWAEGDYVEALMKQQLQKQQAEKRKGRVEFVPAAAAKT